MELDNLQKNWNEFGKKDPLWAILTSPGKKGNKWEIDEFFRTGRQEIEAVMRYATSFGTGFQNRKALDFGCGVGRLTQALAIYYDEVKGIDIAPSMIELANKYNKFGEKCHYILNESSDLKLFENNSFDFIYSNIVLQHMKPEYSKNYIKEFLRILVPGGIAIFQIPSGIKLPAGKSAIKKALPNNAFKAHITLSSSPAIIEASSRINLLIKVKNDSSITWPALGMTDGKYQIRLGNHWLDEKGNVVINDDARASLTKNIEPSDEVKLSLLITAPHIPGFYILELDMVQEMVSWFKDKGSETTRVNITVKRVKPEIIGNQLKLQSDGVIPIMEMYGIQKKEVIDLIKENKGIVIDIKEDYCAGEQWLSFRYCITK
ncbi:MAG TPA: methyltransferase domain-containing protein [Candidatus Methanoperedens sp.]